MDESLKEELDKALKSLSTKEAQVVRMYFGLNLDRPLTLEEIGSHFRLTRERVRQIKERAITRLRHQSRCKFLRQYLG
jgi:RNA polymerase primary sigma factor